MELKEERKCALGIFPRRKSGLFKVYRGPECAYIGYCSTCIKSYIQSREKQYGKYTHVVLMHLPRKYSMKRINQFKKALIERDKPTENKLFKPGASIREQFRDLKVSYSVLNDAHNALKADYNDLLDKHQKLVIRDSRNTHRVLVLKRRLVEQEQLVSGKDLKYRFEAQLEQTFCLPNKFEPPTPQPRLYIQNAIINVTSSDFTPDLAGIELINISKKDTSEDVIPVTEGVSKKSNLMKSVSAKIQEVRGLFSSFNLFGKN